MTNLFSLTNKNALITGGSRGIGLAVARGFLDSGASVTICSRSRENIDEALNALRDHGGMVHGQVAHVGDSQALEELVTSAENCFGPVNVLVNNAGTNPYFGPLLDATEEAWDKTMQVNLKAPFMLSKVVASRMKAFEGGSIINIASVGGLAALQNQGIYSVSKAGLIMLTKNLAKELGRDKIRVNCICPGLIQTKLSEALWKDPQREESVTSQKALGRIGLPEEVVGAAIYLAADASSFTTGAVLQVDGGLVI